MSATQRVRIASTSIRIENIDFGDFLGALSKILEDKELQDVRPQSLTLYSPKRGRYMQIQAVTLSPEGIALTVTCDDTELLESLIESVKKLYWKEATA